MIVKIRMLGLRGADAHGLRAAGVRIRDYLEGRSPDQLGATAQAVAGGQAAPRDAGPDAPAHRLAAYYAAGTGGLARGRARGAGAGALGFEGDVDGDRLVDALVGRHPLTGRWLTDPKGSSGRSDPVPRGSRPVASHGPADEVLTLPEAAFLSGVDPSRLRRLAEHQPRTVFPDPTSSDKVDARVGRRLIEALTGRALDVPWPEARKDYLLAEKDPESGHWGVRRGELRRYMAERIMPETVMGFDMVCALPKSVSLLWAVGDEAIRADIATAFDAAVDATVAYLEAHACYGKIDGRNQPGEGLALASYVHDVSRADDPHLHMHNLIPNAVRVPVRDEDGRPVIGPDGEARVEWRALDSGTLLRHVKTAGYLGAAEFRHVFARRRGIEWHAPRNGVAEIAGFPLDLLNAVSSRHEQVLEELAQLLAEGHDDGAATEEEAQRRSRPPKTAFADAEMRARQAAKLAELGWPPERVLALIEEPARPPEVPTAQAQAELADRLVGPRGLTARQTTFTAREVHQAVAQWAGDRMSAAQIRATAEAFRADSRVVACAPAERSRTRQDPEAVFTTEDLLAAEDNLQVLYRQGRVDHGGEPRVVVAGAEVDAALAAADIQLRAERDDPARLSDEQRDLVRDVLGSGDLIRCVLGPAGTGKTEAMRAAAAAWSARGLRVLGCANGGAQTEELGRRLGVDAQVVRSWLTRLETAEDPAEVWPEGTVVVVDEATQVATRDAERLARWATRTGTVLVFVGDPAQLGSVGAGGWFRAIVYAHGAPRLSTVYRQAGADLAEVRGALADLRSEMPARIRRAMDRLAADGRIRVFDRPELMLAQVVDDWYADRQARLAAGGERALKPSRMMAAHHREVDLLNALARRRLMADGTLQGPELVVGERRFEVGDEVVTLTQEGHTLVPAGAPRHRYVRTGTVGVVTAVHPQGVSERGPGLTVEFPDRGAVFVDWDYLTHEFEDGRTGGLTHAYAVTADRAEGSSMHAGRPVATDRTSRAAFYVMMTRGEREIVAYVMAERDLAANLDDEQWLPVLRHPRGPFEAVVERLERSRSERLAGDLDPLAAPAHELRRGRSLAELARLRRAAEADPEGRGERSLTTLAVARKAELAEETAVGARVVDRPDPALVARLGPRPAGAAHRRNWDAAVRAVAAYRARWLAEPGTPGYGRGAAWAFGDRPPPEQSMWAEQRSAAERLVARWAAALDPAHQRRFAQLVEHVPRERAIAGVHALLAAGLHPDDVYAALHERERDTARAGAAVLEYRVKGLLAARGVDATPYRMPPPLAAAEEWDRAARRLITAEADYLSRRPVAELAAERADLARLVAQEGRGPDVDDLRAGVEAARAEHERVAARAETARRDYEVEAARRRPDPARLAQLHAQLETWDQRRADHAHALAVCTERLRGAEGAPGAAHPLRERHEVLTLALDQLVDRAVLAAADRPPAYLVELLGERPPEGEPARAWDAGARRVESWRHHALGLPYGMPAAGPAAPPSERALGPVPSDPGRAAARARLLDRGQVTLDLGRVG